MLVLNISLPQVRFFWPVEVLVYDSIFFLLREQTPFVSEITVL